MTLVPMRLLYPGSLDIPADRRAREQHRLQDAMRRCRTRRYDSGLRSSGTALVGAQHPSNGKYPDAVPEICETSGYWSRRALRSCRHALQKARKPGYGQVRVVGGNGAR
jgi:hypothetical protein